MNQGEVLGQEALSTNNSLTWALNDHLGTPRDLGKFNAYLGEYEVVEHRVYDSFGNITSATGSGAMEFGFTGQMTGEGGYLHHNRRYDPETGRWLSDDPLGFAAGDVNLQRYVGNDVLHNTDPSGLIALPKGLEGDSAQGTGIWDAIRKGVGKFIHQQKVKATVAAQFSVDSVEGFAESSINTVLAGVWLNDLSHTPQKGTLATYVKDFERTLLSKKLKNGPPTVTLNFGSGLFLPENSYPRDTIKTIGGTAIDIALPIPPIASIGKGALTGAKIARRAKVLAPRGALDQLDDAFHYTARQWGDVIKREGLRPGSYATPNGNLSGLGAKLELALPPTRRLANGKIVPSSAPDIRIRIDLDGLRKAGYEIPTPRRVSNVMTGPDDRVYTMPGGGYELQFPFEIPGEFLEVLTLQ